MKTKTIKGIKFHNTEIWVKDELKTIFTMTKKEIEYILPRLKTEYWEHKKFGDGRTARGLKTIIKSLKTTLSNYEILNNYLNK